MCCLVETECYVLIRHNIYINENITISGTILRHPAFALVIRSAIRTFNREIVPDGLTIKSGNLLNCCPRSRVATSVFTAIISCPVTILIRIVDRPIAPSAIMVVKINLFISSISKRYIIPAIIIAVVLRISVFLSLELKCVFVPVEIHIHYRIALSLDCDTLVKLFVVKTSIAYGCPSITVPLHLEIVILISYSVDCTVNIASFWNWLNKVIAIACKILLPYNNGIWSSCIRDPARIDCSLIGQYLIKIILRIACAISFFFRCKPPAKCVSVADHVGIIRTFWFIWRIYELRCIIGCAFAVLIKDKPVAFWCIDTERDISCDCNYVVVLVGCTLCIVNNVAGALFDLPAFKVIVFILYGISHVHFVSLFCRGWICTESDLFLSKRDFVFVQIGDTIIFKQHCIISDYCSICFRWQHATYRGSYVCNRKSRGFCRIISNRCPATEINIISQLPNAWVIKNLLHVVVFLNIHGCNFCLAIEKLNKNSRIFTGLNHCINRKAVSIKACFFTVLFHIVDNIHFSFVINVDDLAVGSLLYAIGLKNYFYFFQWLNLFSIFIKSNINSFYRGYFFRNRIINLIKDFFRTNFSNFHLRSDRESSSFSIYAHTNLSCRTKKRFCRHFICSVLFFRFLVFFRFSPFFASGFLGKLLLFWIIAYFM